VAIENTLRQKISGVRKLAKKNNGHGCGGLRPQYPYPPPYPPEMVPKCDAPYAAGAA